MWHSNAPWLTSAYGLQTALFAPRVNALDGHEIVAISAPYSGGGAVLEWQGIPVLPCVRDVAGCDVLPSHYEWFGADALISLCDPFGLLKCARDLAELNFAPWTPVDCMPLGAGDATVLRDSAAVPVAMSRFGEQVLRYEGVPGPLYCPHACDTYLFAPGDPAAYRDTVPGMTAESFVIGLIGVNRGRRKAFDQQFLAFSRFRARHPDSFLAVHSAPASPHPACSLQALAARLGISGSVAYPEAYLYDTGQITQAQMAAWYSGLDVLSFCSYGEGFGVPLIEAQACAVPVITTDGSAMSELCGSGWLVSGTPDFEDGHQAWWKRPDAADIEQAYEAAWQARENGQMPALKASARAFALNYDVDRVFADYMVPALKTLEERFT